MTLTLDTLIENILRDYRDAEVSMTQFNELYGTCLHKVYNCKNVYSVVLNFESKDVRYLHLDFDAFEVKPRTVVSSVYEKV